MSEEIIDFPGSAVSSGEHLSVNDNSLPAAASFDKLRMADNRCIVILQMINAQSRGIGVIGNDETKRVFFLQRCFQRIFPEVHVGQCLPFLTIPGIEMTTVSMSFS